jgi:hypothetical protein
VSQRRNALGGGHVDDARLRYLHEVITPLVQVHGVIDGVWIPADDVTAAVLVIDGETICVSAPARRR